jgi:hypothetical protein
MKGESGEEREGIKEGNRRCEHGWKCHNEIHYFVQLIYNNKSKQVQTIQGKDYTRA